MKIAMACLIGCFLTLGSTSEAAASKDANWTDKVKISGSARVRYEGSKNKDFFSRGNDSSNFTGSRFRLNVDVTPNSKTKIFLQPEMNKTWGQVDSTGAGTSGGLNDTEMTFHQAFFTYEAFRDIHVKLGRQELIYGDHLLVGNVGWAHTARSFDAGKVRWGHSMGWVDLFASKVTENDTVDTLNADRNFNGLYSSFDFGAAAKNVDFYILHQRDKTQSPNHDVIAFGSRVKSKVCDFDYRFEGTFEKVQNMNEFQLDAEVGHTFGTPRVSFEYFHASDMFNELFPTAHKWLGYADFFKRQNIRGFRLGAKSKIVGALSASLDYHSFIRAHDTMPSFRFTTGGSYGSTGTSDGIADEIDLVFTYKLPDGMTLKAGGSKVFPKGYIKDNAGSGEGSFFFAQASTGF